MPPHLLAEAVVDALRRLVGRRVVAPDVVAGLSAGCVPLERLRSGSPGDVGEGYATNLALRLAPQGGMPPRRLAEVLAEELAGLRGVVRVTTGGPGFVNVALEGQVPAAVATEVVRAGPAYGRSSLLSGQCVWLQPDPSGPAGRGTPGRAGEETLLREVLTRLLTAAGAEVHDGRAGPSGRSADTLRARPVEARGGPSGLTELVELVGDDAFRYALARCPADSPVLLDVDLATRATDDNPLFRVQYAHARLCSTLRNATALGLAPARAGGRPPHRSHPSDVDLARNLAELPWVVANAARVREPCRLARHLEDTAAATRRFLEACATLPQGDEPPGERHRQRLLLVDATRVVLENGLALLGVSAPERI